MPNTQPPSTPSHSVKHCCYYCRRRHLCVHYFGATQPEFLFVYVCVCVSSRSRYALYTHDSLLLLLLRIVFIHLFFIPVVVLFSFLIRTRRLTIIQQRLRGRSSGKLDHPATIRRWQYIPYILCLPAYLYILCYVACIIHIRAQHINIIIVTTRVFRVTLSENWPGLVPGRG